MSNAPRVRVAVVHGGDNDSLNLIEALKELSGIDLHVTDGKHCGTAIARSSLQDECEILMICGHGYRDGQRWCMGGFERGWLTPAHFPQPFPAKLVVFDACGVTDELLRDWQQSGYLAAETVVAYGGGQRAKEASPTVRPKQNLVVVRLLDSDEVDAANCSASVLRRLLKDCIEEERSNRSVYRLFPEEPPA